MAITKNLYFIDSPGLISKFELNKESDLVLLGVIRPERLEDPESYIQDIIDNSLPGSIE